MDPHGQDVDFMLALGGQLWTYLCDMLGINDIVFHFLFRLMGVVYSI